jgi:hypothetical protein
MSALPPKADIRRHNCHVRFVPIADVRALRSGALIERGKQLPALRRAAAFAAHVEKSAEARRTLDQINLELSTHESELQSLDEAIVQGQNRRLLEQALAAEAADRARAREAVQILAKFRQAGADMDQALRTVSERGHELNVLLGRLHDAGVSVPTREQLDTLGYHPVMTSLMQTPWHQRFRYLGPSERRSFGQLFADWCSVAEGRLKSLLAEPNDAAA